MVFARNRPSQMVRRRIGRRRPCSGVFSSNTRRAADFAAFLFLGFAYSAPPLRLKAKPMLDCASNILYLTPGFLGFYQTTGVLPPDPVVIALVLWTSAMHLFSIPDISADRTAGVRTTAVFLVSKRALFACFLFWAGFSSLVLFATHGAPWSFVVILYPAIPAAVIMNKQVRPERVYWFFPYVNGLLGLWLALLAGHPRLYELIVWLNLV